MAEQLTYDPLVGGQSVQRVRLLSPLRPPPPGRALVLVPDAGPTVTVRPGEHVPDARFGVYQGMFMVDITEHRLVLPVQLAGRDAAFFFHCRVALMCQVADPAQVVARGIRDVAGTLYGPARELLREVSREYGAGQVHEAEEALNTALRDFTGDPAVRLRDVQVELLATDVLPVDAGQPGAHGTDAFGGHRRSRVRGSRADPPTGPEEPDVLLGEVVARKDEPSASVSGGTTHRRASRVRGRGPADGAGGRGDRP